MFAEPLHALTQQWRKEADTLRTRYADERAAVLFEHVADDLEETIRDAQDRLLSLQEAAEVSGYSAEHLARLIREGKIPNAGRKGAPRIRQGDLPVKSAALRPVISSAHVDGAQDEQIVAAIVAQEA